MIKLKKQFPATGWIKADSGPDSELLKEILYIKKENELLKTKLQETKIQAPLGSEKLAQGDDPLSFELNFCSFDLSGEISSKNKHTITGSTTWDALFASIAPHLIIETTDAKFKNQIVNHLKNVLSKELEFFENKNADKFLRTFSISDLLYQKIKIQMRALGYIKEIPLNETCSCHWTLTEYGELIMNQIIAVKHNTKSTS